MLIEKLQNVMLNQAVREHLQSATLKDFTDLAGAGCFMYVVMHQLHILLRQISASSHPFSE